MNTERLPRILVIDDEHFIRDLLMDFFSKSGYDIVIAPDGNSGIAEVGKSTFDAVLVDLKMPDKNGTEVLAEIRAIDAGLPVIIMTGYPTVEASIEALRHGAHDFIVKPFRLHDLKERIDRAIRSRLVSRDIAELRSRMDSLEREVQEFKSLSGQFR